MLRPLCCWRPTVLIGALFSCVGARFRVVRVSAFGATTAFATGAIFFASTFLATIFNAGFAAAFVTTAFTGAFFATVLVTAFFAVCFTGAFLAATFTVFFTAAFV